MTEHEARSSSFLEHINPDVLRSKASATLAINELTKRLESEGKKIFRLGFGQSPFPVPQRVVEALRASAHRKEYLPVSGLSELRDAVARFHTGRHGFRAEADEIIIGPGSKELMFLLQLVWKGNVLLPSPSWVSYEPQAKLLGKRTIWIDTRPEDDWLLDPERLERVCSSLGNEPLLLILNYPGNPTGTTFSADHLEEIAEVSRRHNILVLSDEIYGELTHGDSHRSIAGYYPEGTIVSGGISKWCGAGGWRLGTFRVPAGMKELFTALGTAASETFSAVNAPTQYAAVEAYSEHPEIEKYLSRSRKVLGALGRWSALKLNGVAIETAEPAGGFYLFPDFGRDRESLFARGVDTSSELCRCLLDDAGVALLPGSEFGRPPEELTCRIAYVDFDGAECLEAADDTPELDERWLRKYCGRVVDGIERISDWVRR